MVKRVQGRPSQINGVVGRAKIVEEIRSALRSDHTMKTLRKDMAHAAGVTPALITYYFPDKTDLKKALSVPVVEAHRSALSQIVNREHRPDTKLRDILSVLCDLYGKDRRLYEMYQEIENLYPDDYAETSKMTQILSSFFGDVDPASPLSFATVVLQGAVRRMCEVAAQVELEATSSIEPAAATPMPAWFESLYCLFSESSVMTGQKLAA